MIKKIFLAIIICCVVISCGKKGDPVYKNSQKKIEDQKILNKKV
tara:strand:- start:73 stop:204 length:132 start_codon:yes stop_codon:yes gene_type:complete